MFWFAIEVALVLDFLAPVAFHSAVEVVVLALGADPPTIREVELLHRGVLHCHRILLHVLSEVLSLNKLFLLLAQLSLILLSVSKGTCLVHWLA